MWLTPTVLVRATFVMQRKIFWLLFLTLGVLADILLPFIWGVLVTLPLAVLCWWIAYRSGWFE